MTAESYFDKDAGVRSFLKKGKDILSGKNIEDAHILANKKYGDEINRVMKKQPKGATWTRDDKRKQNIPSGWTKEGIDEIRKSRSGILKGTQREKHKTYGARGVVGATAVSAAAYASSRNK